MKDVEHTHWEYIIYEEGKLTQYASGTYAQCSTTQSYSEQKRIGVAWILPCSLQNHLKKENEKKSFFAKLMHCKNNSYTKIMLPEKENNLFSLKTKIKIN